jgi:hypothetical protein
MHSLLPHPLYLRGLVQKKDLDEIGFSLSRIVASSPAAHVCAEVDSVRAMLNGRRERSEDDYWQSVEDAVFRLAVALEKETQQSAAEVPAAVRIPSGEQLAAEPAPKVSGDLLVS